MKTHLTACFVCLSYRKANTCELRDIVLFTDTELDVCYSLVKKLCLAFSFRIFTVCAVLLSAVLYASDSFIYFSLS